MAAGLLELLDSKPGERILDIGCGTGHLTAQIAATGAYVIGIDCSAEMIRQARAAHLRAAGRCLTAIRARAGSAGAGGRGARRA